MPIIGICSKKIPKTLAGIGKMTIFAAVFYNMAIESRTENLPYQNHIADSNSIRNPYFNYLCTPFMN